MSPESFCYWLSGFFELSQHSNAQQILNEKQVEEIKNHLKLVMTKATSEISNQKEVQLPLFPTYPVITSPIYPTCTDDSTTGKSSWPTYPQVSCCSSDVIAFHHTGD